MADTKNLSPARLAAFALPAAPLLALTLPPAIFLPPYFNEVLGVPLALVSAIFLGARLFDFVIDPFIGALQDRTVTRFGRRRFWLAAALGPLCFFIFLVFDAFGPGTPAPFLFAAMFALYAAFSTMMIAHLGWAGELAPDYDARTRTLGAVQIAGAAGQIAILVLPAIVALMHFGGKGSGVHIMGWTMIVALPIATLIAIFAVPEPPAVPQKALTLGEALKTIAENKTVRRVLAPDFLTGISQGVSAGLFVFYVQYALGFTTLAEALLLLYFVAALAGVPFWVWYAQRSSKHRAVQIAALYTAATFLIIPLLPVSNLMIAAPGMFIAGLGNGAPTLLLRAMMADVVDEDQVKTGVSRSGLLFGLLMTTSKVGAALGPATYAVLAIYGFDAKLGAGNTPQAMTALTLLFAGVPFALNVLTAASLIKYPLTEARQHELRAQIEHTSS